MSDFDLIIRGGSVVRPDGVAKLDLGIKDGVITALGNAVFGSTDSDLDAGDYHVFPGGVDPHVHCNEPGRTDWEGFDHGTRALAAGGVTSFFDMPLNAQPPVLDKGGFLAKWNFAKASSFLDFGLWGGLCAESLTHMQELTDCGVIGFKAFMCNSGVDDFPMADDGTLLEGMRRAFDLEQIVAVHAENEGITASLARRAVADGRLSAAEYLASRPAIAELEAIQRAILFAWETECSLHIVHVSTARGIELVAGAKAQGLNISCETCPHYLILTEADVERLGPLAKCAPPLRTRAEQTALWEKLAAGGIDMIASDHSPAPPSMKTDPDFFKVWGGIAGCQHLLGLLCDLELPPELVARLTAGAVAERFQLSRKGKLEVGCDADLALFDPGGQTAVTAEALQYRHKITPYLGRTLRGAVRRTILRGRTIAVDGRPVGEPSGQLVTFPFR